MGMTAALTKRRYAGLVGDNMPGLGREGVRSGSRTTRARDGSAGAARPTRGANGPTPTPPPTAGDGLSVSVPGSGVGVTFESSSGKARAGGRRCGVTNALGAMVMLVSAAVVVVVVVAIGDEAAADTAAAVAVVVVATAAAVDSGSTSTVTGGASVDPGACPIGTAHASTAGRMAAATTGDVMGFPDATRERRGVAAAGDADAGACTGASSANTRLVRPLGPLALYGLGAACSLICSGTEQPSNDDDWVIGQRDVDGMHAGHLQTKTK